MRIVFVLALADVSGGARTVATYAKLLSERGHRVTVVSTPPPAPSLRSRVKSLIRGRGWPGTPPPPPSHIDRIPVEHRRLDRFRPVVDRDVPDADVVVATWWLTAEWIAALSPRKGAKAHFVQGHESDLPGQPSERVAATWRLPLHRIVCSGWLLDLAVRQYGDANASYVPNGIDVEQFWVPPRERNARPTVGLVYSDAWIKGCDVAVAAFDQAARCVPGLDLISFGSGPLNPALPLPRGARFVLCPPESEIPRLYGSCDAWLWPSRCEGFGLPILEAMACRTPVIASPAGAAPEVLASGGGILLPAADPSAMASAIEKLAALSPYEWRRLSEEARAVAECQSWARVVGLFESALETARSGGAPVRPTKAQLA